MPRDVKIQSRRGTASEWTSVNPVLALGELGVETDTHKIKAGDDETHWNDLPYVTGPVDGDTVSLQVKRDTETNLAASTTPIPDGTLVYNQTTGRMKIGDGETLWQNLPDPGKQFKNVITVAKDGAKGSADFICSDSQWNSDDECIQAAIDYCATHSIKELWINEGEYTPLAQILITSDINFKGIGKVIFHQTTQNVYMLRFGGGLIKTINGTANVYAGDVTITVSDSTNIVPGDMVLISDDVVWNTDPTWNYGNWKTGELHEVKIVSGSVIEFHEGLLHNYSTTQNIKVIQYRPIIFSIENIIFDCPSEGNTLEYLLLRLQYLSHSVIKNCTFLNGGYVTISIDDCFDVIVDNCYIANAEKEGNGYGVSIANACAHIHVQNSDITACRHGVMLGGSGTVGQPRDIRVHDNTFYGTVRWPVDAHEIAESFFVYNNTIYNKNNFAIVSGAKITEFKNNYIHGGYGAGIRGFTKDMIYKVEDNTFEHCADIFYDVHTYSGGNNTEKYVSVKNNTVLDAIGKLVRSRYAQYIDVRDNYTSCETSITPTVTVIDNCDATTGWSHYSNIGGTVESITVEDGRIKVVGTASALGQLCIRKIVNASITGATYISYSIESNVLGFPRFTIYDTSDRGKSWELNDNLALNKNTKFEYRLSLPAIDIPQSPNSIVTNYDGTTNVKSIIVGLYGMESEASVTFYIDNIYIRTGDVDDSTGIYIENATHVNIFNNKILNSPNDTISSYECDSISVLENPGYPTENTGTATITASQTSVTISHGLVAAPTKIIVTPFGNVGNCWVDYESITATEMTIHCSTAPEADTVVSWSAQVV